MWEWGVTRAHRTGPVGVCMTRHRAMEALAKALIASGCPSNGRVVPITLSRPVHQESSYLRGIPEYTAVYEQGVIRWDRPSPEDKAVRRSGAMERRECLPGEGREIQQSRPQWFVWWGVCSRRYWAMPIFDTTNNLLSIRSAEPSNSSRAWTMQSDDSVSGQTG
jgi:hypothetical protein